MVSPPIPDDIARQAVDSLAGYAYQLYQTLSAWLALGPDEFLFVEVAEDYAVATTDRLKDALLALGISCELKDFCQRRLESDPVWRAPAMTIARLNGVKSAPPPKNLFWLLRIS